MNTMNVKDVIEMLLYVSEQMMTQKEILCCLDSEIGDGDHGIGIERGFYYLHKNLMEMNPHSDMEHVFQLAHMTLMSEMGGASGIIFSCLFKQQNLKDKKTLDVKDWQQIMENGLVQIQQFGHAQPGDKTMVDALAPAVEAMNAYKENDLGCLFEQGWKAAEEGKERTKLYLATFGRARFVKERSIGYVDPGAASMCFILQAMFAFIHERKKLEM